MPFNFSDPDTVRRIHEAIERVRALRIASDTAQRRRQYNDTDEMPDDRGSVLCKNCGRMWLQHRGWACDTWYLPEGNDRDWRRSELLAEHCFTTPDMVPFKNKKFSHVSLRRLRKTEREHLLSKESLLK